MGFNREFTDRVCFFYAERIAEQGSLGEFFGNPKHGKTKQFLSVFFGAD